MPKRRARRLRDVAPLVESIAQADLIEPIIVRRMPDGRLVLISGAHRLEAHRQLGRQTILARIVVVSDLEAELIELDENLARIPLTALERGEHLLRRKRIYEELYPEAKHGGAPGKRGGGKAKRDATVASFAEDASAKTGLSARTIQDDVKIARMSRDARQAIRGTPIEDQKRVLLQITRIAPDKQAAVAEAVASGRCRSVAQAAIELGVTTERSSRPQSSDIKARVRAVAKPLREARERLVRLARDLDPAHASEAQAIGAEIGALEKKIAALMGSSPSRTGSGAQNDMAARATTSASDTVNTPSPSMASELARPSDDAHDAPARREEGPRVDVAAAVEAAIEFQKLVIADKTLGITGLGVEELHAGEALVEPLAEMARAMVRLSRPDRGRRRGAPRRPGIIPKFVKALLPSLPANSALAREHGEVLRALEVFDLARKYLCKIDPAIETAFNHHAPMRADNASSAGICNAIDRYIDHGRAFVAGEYTFRHHLEAQRVPLAIHRDAHAALARELAEGTFITNDSLGERSKCSSSPAQNAPEARSSIRLPLTAPLDEAGFKEMREIVRGNIEAMNRGRELLAKIYAGRPVPPGVEKVCQDAFERAQQCGPLLDGTFTYADHLRAWSAHPATLGAERGTEASDKSNAAMSTELPAPPQPAEVEPLPAAAQKEFGEILTRYMAHGMREQVAEEIRKMDWPPEVREAALQLFWAMAGKHEPSAPPLPDDLELPGSVPNARATRFPTRARRRRLPSSPAAGASGPSPPR